jgi:hypothetical protein
MKFTLAVASLLTTLLPSLVCADTLSFDNTYDNASGDMNTVACSTGLNGLVTKGFKTFGSLPDFPLVGGGQAVAGFNSTNCGTCWALTFAPTGKTVNILVIDHAQSGFNVAQAAMDRLTNNQAVELGRVNVTSKQVAASACGLS